MNDGKETVRARHVATRADCPCGLNESTELGEKMERRATSVVVGGGNEPSGNPLPESGPLDICLDPVSTRTRLPYPFCLAMQSGNEKTLRDAVRRLVEGAV